MEPLRIFLTTWNTGLQGSKAQSQDLTSWLLPVLHKTANDPDMPEGVIPDIYAIAVQELLPVHLACELPHSSPWLADMSSGWAIWTSPSSIDRANSIPPFGSCDFALLGEEAGTIQLGLEGISWR